MSAFIRRFWGKDASSEDLYRSLFYQVAFLSLFGIVMLFSTTYATSLLAVGKPTTLFLRQLVWVALGWVGFLVCSRVIPSKLSGLAVVISLASVAALLMVLVPGVGKSVMGASRWIGFGMFQFQPSEFAKLALALFVAKILSSKNRDFGFKESTFPVLAMLGAMFALVILEPDMGTAIVLSSIVFGVLVASGIAKKQLGALGILGAVVGAVLAFAQPYRRARMLSFLHPWVNRTGASYQEVQALGAFASGHLVGQGLGAGQAIWGYLPNAQSDFVFAVVGQQFGLLGSLVMILQFVMLVLTLFRIAARAAVSYDGIFAAACACWLASQTVLNIGAVEGVLPVTGVPLPLISAGGSSTLVIMSALGLVRATLRNKKVELIVLNGQGPGEERRSTIKAVRAIRSDKGYGAPKSVRFSRERTMESMLGRVRTTHGRQGVRPSTSATARSER